MILPLFNFLVMCGFRFIVCFSVDLPITAVGQSKSVVDCGFKGLSAEENTFSYENVSTVAAKMDSNIGLKLHEALCDVKKYEGYVCFVPHARWNQFQVGFQRNVVSEKRDLCLLLRNL
jgi:hypothetical protein